MGKLMKEKFQFKSILPKSLLKRMVLIIVTPLILVQTISFFVFWDRYVDSVTRSNAGNISSSIHLITKLKKENNASLSIVQKNIGIDSYFYPNKKIKDLGVKTDKSWANHYLSSALNRKITAPYLIDSDEQLFKIYVQVKEGILKFNINRKRLISRTAPLVFIWGIGASVLFLIIAILFMKNQVRPIRNLAIAAEKFGKGEDFIEFKESGATEVRQAGLAFNKMKERIRRQIQQRTDMLAAISHDLRTPLTRIKLELEMMPNSKENDLLKKEVIDMQNMIGEYLQFVKGDTLEVAEETDLSTLISDVCAQFSRKDFKVDQDITKAIHTRLKPGAIKRVLNNILENAKRFSSHAFVQLTEEKLSYIISVEDNGPGVMEDYYQEIIKPFVRLDTSRNIKTGGIGLGLSIVADIITNHGGAIRFNKASLGGLKVIIKLPK